MSARIRAHIRNNLIGYIALFFALSTGSAVALNGTNTVFTDDIVNDQVYSADVRDDTFYSGGLRAVDLRPNAVGTSEVANGSLTGSDILNGSVGTADIGTIPAARATSTSAQSIPDGAGTIISLDSEAATDGGFDTANLHDDAVNNSRLTAPVGGVYLVSADMAWQVDGTGFRQISIASPAVGGGNIVAADATEPVSSVNNTRQAVSGLARLGAGDYVELSALQNSGGALNSLADSNEYPFLSMVWVGP